MNIFVKNSEYETVAVIDSAESVLWTDRFQEAGDFEIYTAVTAELLSIFRFDRFLQIEHSDRTMIIESIQITTDVENGNKLLIKGRSLESILERRVVISQTRMDTDVQSAIFNVIDRAFITPEDESGSQAPNDYNRELDNLVWVTNSDPAFAAKNVKVQYYGDNVYDIVKTLSAETDIGFKLVLNSLNQIVMNLYIGSDRTYDQVENPYVIFSPQFDNLLSSDYFVSKQPFKNWTMIYSHTYDTGEFHTNVAIANPMTGHDPTGLEHRERFLDLSSMPRTIQDTTDLIPTAEYNSQIISAGRQILLLENTIIEEFQGQADTTVSFQYGTDYFLGDIVQIENEYSQLGTARITEITFSESPSGIFVYPTFKPL